MPFEELSHTADWCLRVWAADLNQLFVETARGMNVISGIRLAEEPRVQRSFSISAPDIESLLVSFLSELVYLIEQDQLAFDEIDLIIDKENCPPCGLYVNLRGASILALDKVIKAVTFHNIHIQQTTRGVEVEVVFDV